VVKQAFGLQKWDLVSSHYVTTETDGAFWSKPFITQETSLIEDWLDSSALLELCTHSALYEFPKFALAYLIPISLRFQLCFIISFNQQPRRLWDLARTKELVLPHLSQRSIITGQIVLMKHQKRSFFVSSCKTCYLGYSLVLLWLRYLFLCRDSVLVIFIYEATKLN